jgi:hypothetical protein
MRDAILRLAEHNGLSLSAAVYNDDSAKPVSAIKERAGERQVAKEQPAFALGNVGKAKGAGMG